MKYSYKILKNYLPFIDTPEKIAKDIIMHTAEVEKIHSEFENLKDVYIWKVLECRKHPESEKLNICLVEVLWLQVQIVCWASNVKAWIKVPVAVIWAKLEEDFVIEKCRIRWETSQGMICSEDELGLVDERQSWILILPEDAPLWVSMRDYLCKNDSIIEVDNKWINHRPDLFSYVWIIRELSVINWKDTILQYEKNDFSDAKELNIKNEIGDIVKRYIGLSISGVSNMESPDYIKTVVESSWNNSKWLLIDISNYSLFFYGQPTHCFDADKIVWWIVIRYAKNEEEFLALDWKSYKLMSDDIVIADSEKVLALWWVIGWSLSAVSESTKNIIVEWAWFNPKIVRQTWRRHGIRTDSLNVFEKDIPLDLAIYWVSLIYRELQKINPSLKVVSFKDCYAKKQDQKNVPFDLKFINNLIGANYSKEESLVILEKLGLKLDCHPEFSSGSLKKDNTFNDSISSTEWQSYLLIPFWRKDLNLKADIAEEVARIKWFDDIKSTIPRINLWAVIQNNIYKLKNDVREFFVDRWFFDMYNYSFVNEELMKKLGSDTANLISLKNSLSEDMTHMRWSLIPNLLLSLEKNVKQKTLLKMFEFEKVFFLNSKKEVIESYNISWVITSESEVIYYDLQNVISDLFKKIWLDNYMFQIAENYPTYSHKWRTSAIIARWQTIWYIGEVHPVIAKNFSINLRIWFFEIDADKLKSLVYNKVKASEISSFQENNFDLNFVVDKSKAWKNIAVSIAKTDSKYIKKVELVDIYENEDKLPWKRSITFKIYIQSLEETLWDDYKNSLIKQIVERVSKIGWTLR